MASLPIDMIKNKYKTVSSVSGRQRGASNRASTLYTGVMESITECPSYFEQQLRFGTLC